MEHPSSKMIVLVFKRQSLSVIHNIQIQNGYVVQRGKLIKSVGACFILALLLFGVVNSLVVIWFWVFDCVFVFCAFYF